MPDYTAEDKLRAVKRELKYRYRVYQRRIKEGKMSTELAEEQVAIFEAIREDYSKLAQSERLL